MNIKVYLALVMIQIVLVLIGSHKGGSLTHGEDFLSYHFNKSEETEIIISDTSIIYDAFIQPVFSKKCNSCHNEKKAKGNLILTSFSGLVTGGKNGPVLKNGDPLNSHIIQRAVLDEEDEKHMPPRGKPQLTKEELDLLQAWIAIGAPKDKRLSDFSLTDSFRVYLNPFIPKSKAIVKENFPAADPDIIQKLQNAHRIIRQQSLGSSALQVRFSIRDGFQSDFISDLKPISEQITEINCSSMPLTDSAILKFSIFPNLTKLNINSTGVGNAGLQHILKIKSLRIISLSNNPIDGAALQSLVQLPNLEKVYCWSTLADPGFISTLKKSNPKIQWETGYIPDSSELLQLTMPMLTDPELFILSKTDGIRFKHPMPGVTIKFTKDGSAPDSIRSLDYKEPIKIDQITRIRSIAVKKGWLTSDTTDHTFFPKPDTPHFAKLITAPEEKYKSEGVRTLFNLKKGSLNNISENWLGYKSVPLEAIFMFTKDPNLHEIIVSALKKTGPYVMPPEKIELWAGNDSTNLKKIYSLIPQQPVKYDTDKNELYHLPVKMNTRFYKIKIFPVTKLPLWHSGKGEKGWTFIDEIFFY